ncbi:MAG: TrbI/VirB10 family protein, partial [Stellaceae bacterium]
IGGALLFALKPEQQRSATELYEVKNRSTPEGLAVLPRDYTGLSKPVPRLGPPLPGDLGRPILNAGTPAPGMRAAVASPEEQRIGQEQEAARTSKLFATTNLRPVSETTSPPAKRSAGSPAVAPSAPGSLTSSDHKLDFLNGAIDRRTTSPDRIEAPASRYVLQADR